MVQDSSYGCGVSSSTVYECVSSNSFPWILGDAVASLEDCGDLAMERSISRAESAFRFACFIPDSHVISYERPGYPPGTGGFANSRYITNSSGICNLPGWITYNSYVYFSLQRGAPHCAPPDYPDHTLGPVVIDGQVYCFKPPDDPPPPPPDQDCQPGVGNPCDPLTGNKSLPVTDYAADGLSFSRTYQSAQDRERRSHLGRGWSHNYGGYITAQDGELHLVTDRGRFHPFVAVNPTLYVSRLSGNLFIEVTAGHWIVRRSDRHEIYDRSTGSLSGVVHPDQPQRNLAIARDGLGRVTAVSNAKGRALLFEYEGDLLSAVQTPDGPIVFAYDPTGYGDHELTGVQYPDHRAESYQYTTLEDRSLLTAVIDNDHAYTGLYDYDESGRVISSGPTPDLAGITLEYLEPGRTRVTTELGEQVEYHAVYGDGWQGFATGSVQSAVPVHHEYADQDIFRPVRSTRGDRATEYLYDGLRREVVRVEAPGTADERTTLTTWNDNHHRRATVTLGDLRTEYQYNSAGQLLSETRIDLGSGASRTWHRSHCPAIGTDPACALPGLLLAETGPDGAVTEYAYYAEDAPGGQYRRGDLERITNAAGHITRFAAYDGAGRPVRIIDPNGVETLLAYDARGRLVSQSVAGETVTYHYQTHGLVSRTTQADGSHVDYHYDSARRLVALSNEVGERIEYVLDAAGNRLEERTLIATGGLRHQIRRVYDQLGRLTQLISGTDLETHYQYDANGRAERIVEPMDRVTSQSFDALDRLRESIDPLQGVSRFGYDEHDRLISVQDPKGLTTTYRYNALGDLVRQDSPDTGVTTFTYDAAGNILTRTDARGRTGQHSHDALGRLTGIQYTDQTLHYSYDQGPYGAGRLTGAGDADHTLAWLHDAHGRVIEKRQTVKGITHTVGYSYTHGHLTTLTTPSGQTLTYSHRHGRPDAITLNGGIPIVSAITHEPFGPVAGWTWGNGTHTRRERDLDGRILRIESAGDYTYAYDPGSRISNINDLHDPDNTWAYHYDLLDRLTTAQQGTGYFQFWHYDANGNRLVEINGSNFNYNHYQVDTDSNRVLGLSGVDARTYTYDAMGNIIHDGTHRYTYNDAGRLIEASGDPVTRYLINALGQRIKKANNEQTRHFVYDEQGRLIGEYDAQGHLIQETVWLEDIPVATLRPGGAGGVQVYYIHTDHLNTRRRITRPSDNVIVWRWDSDAFGRDAADEDPNGDGQRFEYNLRFPGQYYDSETGLHYNYFRDYDPSIGRYVQSDPIGLAGGLNTYGYVAGDPVSKTDPFGLCPSNMRPGPGNSCVFSGDNDRTVCRTAECAAGLRPLPPPPSPKSKCLFSCNVKPQVICTGIGLGTAAFTTPAGGASAGVGCIIIKAVVCSFVCDDTENQCTL